MNGERFWEVWTLGFLPLSVGFLCSVLQFAVLLRMAELYVLQQVGLLHVEERTLGAGEDLGGHLHCGALCSKVLKALVVLQQ